MYIDEKRFFPMSSKILSEFIGLNRVPKLFLHSQEEYQIINDLLNYMNSNNILGKYASQLQWKLKSCDISNVYGIVVNTFKRLVLYSRSRNINIDELPASFLAVNKDLLLLDASIDDNLRERYYNHALTIEDIFDNAKLFCNIPVLNFIAIDYIYYDQLELLSDTLGSSAFETAIQEHHKLLKYLVLGLLVFDFCDFVDKSKANDESNIKQDVSYYLKSFFLQHNKLETRAELLNYNPSLFALDSLQASLLDKIGLDNIRRLEIETGFFSCFSIDNSSKVAISKVAEYINRFSQSLKDDGIDIEDFQNSYDKFLEIFPKLFLHMRRNNFLEGFNYNNFEVNCSFSDYDFTGRCPENFLSPLAPNILKMTFYKNKITPSYLSRHPDHIRYLIDKNLGEIIKSNILLEIPGFVSDKYVILSTVDFSVEYIKRYGNEKYLQLLSKYGAWIEGQNITSLHNEIDDEKKIEKEIRKAIYDKLILSYSRHEHVNSTSLMKLLSNEEFYREYPDLFIDFRKLPEISESERMTLTADYYDSIFSFEYIKKYPELVNLMKDKNLLCPFGRKFFQNGVEFMIDEFGQENFLELCSIYGIYIEKIAALLANGLTREYNIIMDDASFDDTCRMIEEIIIKACKNGHMDYQRENAPSCLLFHYPEMFLDESAPEELREKFYNSHHNVLSFWDLHRNPSWLAYLKNKSVLPVLLRGTHDRKTMIKYFKVFGEEKALKLGVLKPETVTKFISLDQIDLMKHWYDKTGGRFIPDIVIMQNFGIDEIDKFLVSSSNWSSLMRLKEYAKDLESREAMLKLAYSFGAFDYDQRGYKKVLDLLTGIPKKLPEELRCIVEKIDMSLNRGGKNREVIYFLESDTTLLDGAYKKIIDNLASNSIDKMINNDLVELLEAIKSENIDIDISKDIFAQLYMINEDNSSTLTINTQSYPKTAKAIRKLLAQYSEVPMLTPDKAHQLFGGFIMKYDPEFREFMLNNIERILTDTECIKLISAIQKQFTDILVANRNRVLTWELAVSFVQTNKYKGVNMGNERVSMISAIAGYSQDDFDYLQKIYNYGKQRTYSSIPKIENICGKYSYGMLSLDDPLAMAIGTLTDCCQEIGNSAESCMIHSMIDKNGRVFVIKDASGAIIAQSWVWRNGNVLCFDNIEIPEKVISKAPRGDGNVETRTFAEEIFDIYKMAALDLIRKDEKIYLDLLNAGKISEFNYNRLRLNKVTVGLGFNDIANAIKKHAKLDKGDVARPLKNIGTSLTADLYTSDSITQYILENDDARSDYLGETIYVHSDNYIVYNDSNFNEVMLRTLQSLERATTTNSHYLNTEINYDDEHKLVTEIADNYGFDSYKTGIIMNSNFAIIYEMQSNEIRIGDLFFNTKVNNGEQQMDIENSVLIQIWLALEQICEGKTVNISLLNEKQKDMYYKVVNLKEEIDVERGIAHGR